MFSQQPGAGKLAALASAYTKAAGVGAPPQLSWSALQREEELKKKLVCDPCTQRWQANYLDPPSLAN